MNKNFEIPSLKRKNINIINFFNKFELISDDVLYIKYFLNKVYYKIYYNHINKNYVSCMFCRHLRRSHCHEFCFICSKNIYSKCTCLLPGTFSYSSSFDIENHPWMFKTPCKNFERIEKNKYFKNFTSPSSFITAENYEALEGLFTGLVHKKRPCHICASVNLEIYNKCLKNGQNTRSTPCTSILHNISSEYQTSKKFIMHID